MKKIIVSLFLLLFCGVGSNFAQLVRNVEFEVQYDSISQRLGEVYMIKDYKQGERECKQLIELFNSSSEEIKSYYTWLMKDCYYNLACCQSMQNKKNVAIQSLELAYEHNYQNYRQFVQDTDLDNLRNEKRYKTIHDKLKEVGDFQYILQNASGYEPNLRTDTLLRFSYANPNDSNLVRVREYFQLDSVAGSGDELSKIKNILTYIHNIIKHDGNHENPKTVNAIGLAEACKDGSRGLNCRGLATVLNECYLAMGFKSRFITCMPKVYINDCHVINVIYSNTLDKWIWVDPTQNAWVMDENGILLSVQEVRERLRNGQPLILNEEANWNNINKTNADWYLYEYMAKNLYYINSTFRFQFGTEDREFSPKNYVALLPIGYINEQDKDFYIVNDDTWFWQSPYQE